MNREKRKRWHKLLDAILDLLDDGKDEEKREPPRLVFRDPFGREHDLLKSRRLPPL